MGTSLVKNYSHETEREFSEFLESENIFYVYEPCEFILKTDDNLNILEAFRPDFYLPEFDIYIEITSSKQHLISRKNKKIKKARALYPGKTFLLLTEKELREILKERNSIVLFNLISQACQENETQPFK